MMSDPRPLREGKLGIGGHEGAVGFILILRKRDDAINCDLAFHPFQFDCLSAGQLFLFGEVMRRPDREIPFGIQIRTGRLDLDVGPIDFECNVFQFGKGPFGCIFRSKSEYATFVNLRLL